MRVWAALAVALGLSVGCSGQGSTAGVFSGSETGTVESGDECIRAAHLPMSKNGELCFQHSVGHQGQCVTVQFHTPGDVRADGRTYLPVDSAQVVSDCAR